MAQAEFKFPGNQKKIGADLVCPCCNTIITAGMKQAVRGEFVVHDSQNGSCAVQFDRVMQAREAICAAFDGMPKDLFHESDLPARLNTACTVQAARGILVDFAQLLSEQGERLKRDVADAFERVGTLVKEIAKALKIEHLVAEYGF